jgi:hypothetical protein
MLKKKPRVNPLLLTVNLFFFSTAVRRFFSGIKDRSAIRVLTPFLRARSRTLLPVVATVQKSTFVC